MKTYSLRSPQALWSAAIFLLMVLGLPAMVAAQEVSWATETMYSTVDCGSVGTGCAGYNAQRLTTNNYNDKEPRINNNGDIAWLGHTDAGNYEIFRRSAADNEVVRLTVNSQDDTFPWLSESGALAWMGFDGHDWEIYRYQDGAVQQITNNDIDDKYPKINSAGDIAWIAGTADEKGEITDYNVFLFSQGSITQVTTNSQFNVQVRLNNGGDLMWRGKGAANFDIFTKKNGNATVQETSSELLEMYPQLADNGQMVWTKNDGNDEEIMLKLTGDLEATQITNNETPDYMPMFNESGSVVWEGYDGNSTQIFLYSGGGITQLTNSSSDHLSPKINSRGDVAWVATGSDEHGVYILQAASQTLYRLSSTPIGHHNAAIDLNDQGQVVWSGAYNNDFEITVASPSAK